LNFQKKKNLFKNHKIHWAYIRAFFLFAQLSEAPAMRRAARAFVGQLYRLRAVAGRSELSQRLTLFLRTFRSEYTKAIEEGGGAAKAKSAEIKKQRN
jgi:hypothetical protein